MAIIGIDLGTTNSLVSIWKDGKSILIPNNLGEYLTPSVVSVDENGEILIGRTAKERLISHPESTVASFKRDMGIKKVYALGDKTFTPAELSALLLKQLKADAECFLGESVEEAVISVPAYFNDFQRNTTKIAGKMAGLKVERLVNEPSAAALAYRFEQTEEDHTFLVFDFGGGTLDISIVDAFDNVIEIVSVAGDNHLGGDDINKIIAEEFLKRNELEQKNLSKEEREAVLKSAEQLKKQMSEVEEAEMEAFVGESLYKMKLENKAFLEVVMPILERFSKPLKRALNDSEYGWSEIDEIIMIGGSGKMPLVQNYLQFISGKKPLTNVDPDKAVAIGAGIYAGIKERQEEIKDMMLTDICPFTLGTAVVQKDKNADQVMSPIIERNSTLPISRVGTYRPVHPFSKEISIEILQGEHRLAKDNVFLGEVTVKLPRKKNPHEDVEVRYTYDINGILEVDVTVVSTGETINKVIVNKGIHLTEEEIEKKREELKKYKIHPREQEKNRLLIAWGERLYEENTGEIRQLITELLGGFEFALSSQSGKQIKDSYIRTSELFEIIDKSPKNLVMHLIHSYYASLYEDEEEYEEDEE